MKVITDFEYKARSVSAAKKENTIYLTMQDIEWDKIEEMVAEVWLDAFMDTQYQNTFIGKYLNVIMKHIERKSANASLK
ncbi:hypothetical protein PBI_121Q_324 [Escherichia phage 121Q]|uniref:Uncharacterized protein n=1 Tax=Escherichia phage 121Q TaxID=1555202 RepID=A0A097EXN8_9CAUD|nr:hypothetical protein PBI_121Q_324 [Escherichia phage 121Q]AIT14214.1 hypothetical protein PBI_121Q_324 [Escherichia phage 121Q]